MPTAEQGIRCVILCQSLTNTFTPIYIVRLDEQTGNVFILAGDIAVDRQLRTFANPKRAAVRAIHSRLVLTIMAAAIT
ncbi:MAG: DUF6888 family protein [Nostoc sp.]